MAVFRNKNKKMGSEGSHQNNDIHFNMTRPSVIDVVGGTVTMLRALAKT